jgi:hypothetical protein
MPSNARLDARRIPGQIAFLFSFGAAAEPVDPLLCPLICETPSVDAKIALNPKPGR